MPSTFRSILFCVFVAMTSLTVISLHAQTVITDARESPKNLSTKGSASDGDYNALVLAAIRAMPDGGGYSASSEAMARLRAAARFDDGALLVTPEIAIPNFCSGATYLVFLKVINNLVANHQLALDADTLRALAISGQRDGQGIWGRWNANGPGTARLFHELHLGANFIDFEKARAGDFMKIFWTHEAGRYERGHSVIFLGTETRGGVKYVRFWSSNLHVGYSEKSVPRSKIVFAIFSRLESPQNLSRIDRVAPVDSYLASLLSKRSFITEVLKKCGIASK